MWQRVRELNYKETRQWIRHIEPAKGTSVNFNGVLVLDIDLLEALKIHQEEPADKTEKSFTPTLKNIPLLFNDTLVGRAESSGDGRIILTILYRPLIDAINHDDLRKLTIGYAAAVPVQTETAFKTGDRLRSKRSGRIWVVVDQIKANEFRSQDLAFHDQVAVRDERWTNPETFVWMNADKFEG